MTNPAEIFHDLPESEIRLVVHAEKARRSLWEFARQAWHVHHPQVAFQDNWHIGAICEHLEAVSKKQIRQLLINVPPRFLKSFIVSVYWPAWEWIDSPHLQWIAAAAASDVVLRDARQHKEVCVSEWYQKSFMPQWNFDSAQDAKGYFVNTAGGARLSRSTGQRIIGLGGHRILVDDPIDAADAFSDKKQLTEHIRWFDTVLSTRKNSPDTPIVIIMQRLHERDLSGHLLDRGGWEHLCLPNEFDGAKRTTFLGAYDPRKKKGELLFPDRLTTDETERKKKALGLAAYSGQYQQEPAPAEGVIFREHTFQYWLPEKLPKFDYVLGAWDCTYGSTTSDADFVVGQTWGIHGAKRYLLHPCERRRMTVPDMLEAIKEQIRLWPSIRAVIVENKAKGKEVVEALSREIPGLVGWNPTGQSKQGRAYAVTPQFEAGQIFFPHPEYYGWVRDHFLPEVLRFPSARHDDQVDAMTMALIWANDYSKPWFATL